MRIYTGMADVETLKGRRLALELSQQELAALLGITQATVSRNETAADPDRRFLLALEGLAARKAGGENLNETAAGLSDPAKAA